MIKDETSEEKLLKLIRQKKQPEHLSKTGNSVTFAGQKRMSNKKMTLLDSGATALLFFSLGCAVYIVVNHGSLDDEGGFSLGPEAEYVAEGSVVKKEALPETKPFRFYEEKIGPRDIFELPGESVKIEPVVRPRDIGGDFGARFRILGIMLGKDSKVIVENVRTKQTFFMSEGERVEGAMLETIQEDRVIFNYRNEKIELGL